MKFIFLTILNLFSLMTFSQNFKENQFKYERVKEAFYLKWPELAENLKSQGINSDEFNIFIRVFKEEKILEIWVKNKNAKEFKLFKSYPITYSSGIPGPKRKEGDLQVPEGFYFIDRFNPLSNFHLSLGINYPNTSDKVLGDIKPGGDIFIHGSNVSIGCVPISDDKIKEVYTMAVMARNTGQKNIPVHIFPFELTEAKLETKKTNPNYSFWKSLQIAYLYFNKTKTPPLVSMSKSGEYKIN
ncbi:hypothetical protein EGI22_11245 [Lacihabitans sp. LS3-19]|uniref:L,D-transpeptidase family protein n=1 Tax=Lacihabitans sp. LS3-19 TaxID=2487335 RepID=UPI0020CEB601|nr:L,D-transpeptidase family protein [Lacihabitans sp. LS3-19]MCP9768489.1 hypothetical protein [Lacihabitans sp. LS3-19]